MTTPKRPFYRVWWWGDEAASTAELPQLFYSSLETATREARSLAVRYGEVTVEQIHLVVKPRAALLLDVLNGTAIDQFVPILKYTSKACGRCEDCTDGFDGPSCQERRKIRKVRLL